MAEADWSTQPLPSTHAVGDTSPIAPDWNLLRAAVAALRGALVKPTTFGNQVISQSTAAGLRTLTGTASTDHTHSADQVVSGQLNPARLGSGTAASTTILYGDGVWRTAPTNSTGSVTASQISDASTVGRNVLTSADAATARSVIGAGTSSLVLGSTSTNAKPGDYSPPAATTSVQGLVRLSGDLAGTADSPSVPGLAGKAARTLTKRTVTGSYTLVLGDATDVVLHCTASAAVTITLPTDTAVAIAQETSIPWRQYGAGQLTFTGASGVTVLARGGATKSAAQYSEGILTKVAANTWLLTGDVVTA